MGSKEALFHTEVSSFTTIVRKGSALLSRCLPFPCDVSVVDDGLARAKELLRDNYGLAIIWNHSNMRDGPAIIVHIIFANSTLNSRRVLVPIADHQHGMITRILAKTLDTDLVPIVTNETLARGKAGARPVGHGKLRYAHEAISILKQGGVVVLAPQGTRGNYLADESGIERSLRFLVKLTDREQFDRFALLFVGISMKGIQDYNSENLRGLNHGVTYNLRVGRCVTKEEAIKLAGGNYGSWVCEELKPLVPEICQ